LLFRERRGASMHTHLRQTLLFVAGLLLTAQTLAAQAGLRLVNLPGAASGDATTAVALYYPTQAAARAVAMGPFTPQVALRATPDAGVKGLIVLSHGTGGSELGHSSLAVALAQHGYLVAALRHPGDNWQDRSLLQTSPERYFTERPQQLSRMVDALLRDPEWKDRIARDAKGPRIGALGHSAGGYTVLALAGGRPDVSRIAKHCQDHRADDPIFCGMGRAERAATGPATVPAPSLVDSRVRAVVAMAPVGVVFDATSLAEIKVPIALYEAEQDRWLVPRFHARWIAANVNRVEQHRVPNAWHFAFMDTPSIAIATEDGDIAADPPGFDRKAFLQRLGREVSAFFDKALR
jgi:predicted dienelactone hydrolase